MLEYVLLNLIMLSVGILLYLYLRSLPAEGEVARQRNWFEKFAFSDAPEMLDRALKITLYKFLRRANVYILKTENWIMATLSRLKPFAEPEPGRLDFSDLMTNSDQKGREENDKKEGALTE